VGDEAGVSKAAPAGIDEAERSRRVCIVITAPEHLRDRPPQEMHSSDCRRMDRIHFWSLRRRLLLDKEISAFNPDSGAVLPIQRQPWKA
jgi:hypothetical protein